MCTAVKSIAQEQKEVFLSPKERKKSWSTRWFGNEKVVAFASAVTLRWLLFSACVSAEARTTYW